MFKRCLPFLILSSLTLPALAQSFGGVDLQQPEAAASAAEVLNQPSATARRGNSGPSPFGANLFQGGFSNDREDGLNPQYIIQPGDQVSVRIWGAIDFNENLDVDAKGNIFIPKVGPVAVGGVPNSQLNSRVRQAVNSVFTDNVRVYTSLNGAQPVAVFVTGYVPQPGRFSGIPSNSVLHFIDRAGGIDNARGSYRDITVLRGGKPLATIDLYDFILEGVMPELQFRDGDTIVVGVRGATVVTTGDVRNPSIFEFSTPSVTGGEIVEAALIAPGVSYVGVSGIRNGSPYSVYLPVDEFNDMSLQDGDAINFRADQQDDVIVVEIEGSYLGPSRYAVPRDTRLQDLLDHVPVDPALAEVGDLSIRRASIAERQKRSLDESLRRLEARYLTASSQTDAEARIRAQEAQLISEFVSRARAVEPSGRLVVASNGNVADILLQPGDVISIPRRSDSVLLSGEVLVSQAMLFRKGMRARDYIQSAGGFTSQAEKRRIVLVHANGEVASDKNPMVRAGDEIIVLPKVPVKNLQLAATIVDILYKIAIAASVAVQL